MSTDSQHQFSDSEDEQEEEVVAFEEEADLVETVPKDVHEAAIAKLTQELESVKASVEKIKADRDEHIALFKKERVEHADEMAKRQSRIDFLMDKMISK